MTFTNMSSTLLCCVLKKTHECASPLSVLSLSALNRCRNWVLELKKRDKWAIQNLLTLVLHFIS